jgi:hypothetical protein
VEQALAWPGPGRAATEAPLISGAEADGFRVMEAWGFE